MDNLLGFSFCFTFFYRYTLKTIIYLLQKFVFEQKTTDTLIIFVCNAGLAGYLGFLLLRKSFLETNARVKCLPIGALGVARLFGDTEREYSTFEMTVLTVYEGLIPLAMCGLMLLSHRFRPHY